MTKEELGIINSEYFLSQVKRHINDDPLKIALNRAIDNASLVATQVKYLQKARKKLPSFYNACTIFTQKLFEQSSSEQSASHKHYKGDNCIDLTCGLGVDSYYLSKHFNKVVSVERDEIAGKIAEINFERLNAKNIEVVCSCAEEYMKTCEEVDMIYIDPDRRNDENKKLSALENCNPDVVRMLDMLLTKCRKLVIKTSPMFDVSEAFRLFGEHIRVEVISVGGECKEVLIEIDKSIETPVVRATATGYGSFETTYGDFTARCIRKPDTKPKYLIVPDVALRKARISDTYLHGLSVEYYGNNGVGLSDSIHDNIIGKVYEIVNLLEYKPKQLKKVMGKSIEIMKINFPFTTGQICKSTGVREGGTEKWMFCKLDEKLWAIEIKELTLQHEDSNYR